jgi:hypothetical protein
MMLPQVFWLLFGRGRPDFVQCAGDACGECSVHYYQFVFCLHKAGEEPLAEYSHLFVYHQRRVHGAQFSAAALAFGFWGAHDPQGCS